MSTHLRYDGYPPSETVRCGYQGCTGRVERTGADRPDATLYCQEHWALADRDPSLVLAGAIGSAMRDLDRHSDTLIRWPMPSVHDFLGFLVPGTVTYIAAFPSNGKTKFISRMIAGWRAAGAKPWVMPTESMPKGLVTRLACEAAGVNADDAMSYRLRERADGGDDFARQQLARLGKAYRDMMTRLTERGDTDLCIEPTPMLTRDTFNISCRAAAQAGCGIVVVDHIDHVTGDGQGSGYQASENVQRDALNFAQEYDIPIVAMTQLNSSRVQNDPLHLYRRPLLDWLWMKGVKDQIATTIGGLFRPMDPYCDEGVLKGARDGTVETWKIAMPDTMGLTELKGRHSGAKRDRVLHLGVRDGQLIDAPADQLRMAEGAAHGIATHPFSRDVAA